MKTSIQLLIVCSLTAIGAAAQVQKGTDIDAEAFGDGCGYSVSMSDAHTLAVGSPFNGDSFSGVGHTRIFEWSGSAWMQKGTDIDGEANNDRAGYAVSMPDANTVAIGAYWNDGSALQAGHVRVYSWNGTAWLQKGADLNGEAEYDESGSAVCMPDANTVAIGAIGNDGSANNAGHVRVYTWSGSAWLQKGADINGEASGDNSGCAVSMPNANTIAIGARANDGTANNAGQVRVYEWSGSAWLQKGTDINGEAAFDYFGSAVSMPDASTVAIGATDNDGSANNAGHARVFEWSGSAWVQKGTDLDGAAALDYFGGSVSMPAANVVAIGGHATSTAGYARVYTWSGTAWTQTGADINGEAPLDNFGNSVSMPDVYTIAIGGFTNDGNGNAAGHVRVYNVGAVGIAESSFESTIHFYPNPVQQTITITLAKTYPAITLSIFNPIGQQLSRTEYKNVSAINVDIETGSGICFIQLTSGSNTALLKVVKQ